MQRKTIVGAVAGWIVWLLFAVAAYTIEASELHSDLLSTIGGLCRLAAWPLIIGGWLLIWGDGAQPPSWVTSIPFNVLVGLFIYGALGVFAAAVYPRFHKQK